MSTCCMKGFRWNGTPQGSEATLAGQNTYVTGSNPNAAILVIHDIYGWKFENIRLLADQYAEEVGATVYVPDFFGGEELPLDILLDQSRWGEIDIAGFMSNHSKEIREPEMVKCVKALRSEHRFSSVGAVGFCYGGWAVFRLGAKEHDPKLVDCITFAHPSFLTEKEMSEISVPVQINAPEIDPMFTPELKEFALREIPKKNVPFDYQYYPGLVHGFATRVDPEKKNEVAGMDRAKNVMVNWLRLWLHETAKAD